MKGFFLTYVGFFIFVLTVLVTQHHASAQVSSSVALKNYREMFAVKQGQSVDGTILIAPSDSVENVPNNTTVPNHLRNLRVFVSIDNEGMPILYLEKSKPHLYYTVQGSFVVPYNKKIFKWTDPVTITFSATGTDNAYRMFSVNVHTLSATSSELKTNNISQNIPYVATDME